MAVDKLSQSSTNGVPVTGIVRLDPKQTWVSMATLSAIVAGLLAMAWTAAEWKHAVQRNTEAIQDLSVTVQNGMVDRWTARDMEGWSKNMKALNPDLKMPEFSK